MNNVTVVSPAYYPNARTYVDLKTSCSRQEIPFVPYGCEETYNGYVQAKLYGLRKILDSVQTRYVIHADASDSLVIAHRDTVLERCERFQQTWPRAIVFSGDTACFPVNAWAKWIRKRSPSSSRLRYLCAGVAVAEYQSLIQGLDRLISEIEKTTPETCKWYNDDQGWWQQALINRWFPVQIDHNASMILSMKGIMLSEVNLRYESAEYKETGGRPVILHFNGSAAKGLRYQKAREILYNGRL